MKNTIWNNSYVHKSTLVILMVFSVACEKWIDPGYNIDPSAAEDVPMSMVLAAIELDMGFNLMGIEIVQPTNIWMQYTTGANFDPLIWWTYYDIEPAGFNEIWGTIYTTQLINAKILIEKANKLHSPYNAAVGQILSAYSLGVATDLWGDIPYKYALKGNEYIINVPYDSQEQIYSSIDSLLDRAIANLNIDPTDNLVDIEGDVYFDGVPGAWLKAARAIKARHALQLSRRRGEDAYLSALALTDAFESNDDNMKCPFTSTCQNPHYQDVQWPNQPPVMCTTFLNELKGTNDPRIPYYFGPDSEDTISAASPGELHSEASVPGIYLTNVSGPLYLMTYAELKFIEAEAALMTGDPDRAATAYKTAVRSSLLQVTGEIDTTWFNAHIDIENAGTITLEKIIMQKRHALFGQLQAFSDWRRTGIPELTPVPDAELPEIPQRFLYPESERFFNTGNVPFIASMNVPVWWADDN